MVSKLIAQSGPKAGLTLVLGEEEEEWIIGRDPDEATLVVEDSRVSRQHVVCRRTPMGIEIENLSQTNPALLNDSELVEPVVLKEGDFLQIGDSRFLFTLEEAAIATPLPPQEEEAPYDTIFEFPDTPLGPEVHLQPGERWLIKVVAGPNSGAEVRLSAGHSYLLGTDATSCDIVFNDLSISRQHARLTVNDEERVTIEDLGSRNGVVVDGTPIGAAWELSGNSVVSLGTTSLLLVDREAVQETLVAPSPYVEPTPLPPTPEEVEGPPAAAEAVVDALPKSRFPYLKTGPLILISGVIILVALVIIGGISLFTSREVPVPAKNYAQNIETALLHFPNLRYNFNEANGRLFILGHVSSPVQKSELLYNLNNLPFITSIDDNVVVDQYVWEEMNAILAKNPEWAGVSMYAPKPGHFVLTGYLKTAEQAATLQDYIHLNFAYLDLLDNQIVVEDPLAADIQAKLRSAGLINVQPALLNGELTLSGYVSRDEIAHFEQLMAQFKQMQGIRQVKNLTVIISEERSLVDLTPRYPVQGFSQHDGVTVNVLIDDQIVSRNSTFMGMKVISITPKMVILEKDGIKYKIDYNQNRLWQTGDKV